MRKLLSTAVAVGVFASTTIMPAAFAGVAVDALPTIKDAAHDVVNAQVTTQGKNMNVKLTEGAGTVSTVNWETYNIGKEATVNYEFTGHNQTSINKVNAAGGLSQIYGKITDSGCYNCGYEASGKIILLNPNGVLFGEGANVNVNSFTVSTMDGTFDKNQNTMKFTKGAQQNNYGIVVENNAKIRGDKNVAFATDNVTMYEGSQISTNTAKNVGDYAYGKVKIVTSDGVNFEYYNNGAIKDIKDAQTSTDKMFISLNGKIDSGHIDIRNYSTNTGSEINLKGANLKATKAEIGNDGNIWLTSYNKIVSEHSVYDADKDVDFASNKKMSLGDDTLKAGRNIVLASNTDDVGVDHSNLTATGDIKITADNTASVQNGAVLNGTNIDIKANKTSAQVVNNSQVTATKDINITSDGEYAWVDGSPLKAGQDINIKANKGYLTLNNATLTAQRDVNLASQKTIGDSNFTGSTAVNATTGKVALNSTAESVILSDTAKFKPATTLDLTAAKNVELRYNGDLTTEKTNINAGKDVWLTSKEGNVTVKDSTKFLAAEHIYIQGKKDVKTEGTVNMNGIQTNLKAGNDVNVTLDGVGEKAKGLIAEAGNDMNITTTGTLSVSSLVSGNNMTLTADRVIAGLPYTDKQKLPGDPTSDRSYIEVGGEFTSNVTNDNYQITESGDRTDDGLWNRKHHIEYGDEKILLVNKRPVDNKVTDPDLGPQDNSDDRGIVKPGSVPTAPEPSKPQDGQGGGGHDGGDGGHGGSTQPSGPQDGECADQPATPDDYTSEDRPDAARNINFLSQYAVSTLSDRK